MRACSQGLQAIRLVMLVMGKKPLGSPCPPGGPRAWTTSDRIGAELPVAHGRHVVHRGSPVVGGGRVGAESEAVQSAQADPTRGRARRVDKAHLDIEVVDRVEPESAVPQAGAVPRP